MSSAPDYLAQALDEVIQSVLQRCQTLEEMLRQTAENLENARQVANESIFNQIPVIEEMDRVFGQLAMIPVDPSMVAGETNKTLFDFVDAESVRSLQQEAMEQTKEIEQLLGTHDTILSRIATIHQYFDVVFKPEAKEIHFFLVQYHDMADQDITNEQTKQLEVYYDRVVRFYLDMEQCDRYLLRYFSSVNDINSHYPAMFREALNFYEELDTLRKFYYHFLASYQKLTPELERRKQYQQKIQQLLQEMMERLQHCVDEENQLRQQFYEENARFLPSSLCPEIQILAERYEIESVLSEPGSVRASAELDGVGGADDHHEEKNREQQQPPPQYPPSGQQKGNKETDEEEGQSPVVSDRLITQVDKVEKMIL